MCVKNLKLKCFLTPLKNTIFSLTLCFDSDMALFFLPIYQKESDMAFKDSLIF